MVPAFALWAVVFGVVFWLGGSVVQYEESQGQRPYDRGWLLFGAPFTAATITAVVFAIAIQIAYWLNGGRHDGPTIWWLVVPSLLVGILLFYLGMVCVRWYEAEAYGRAEERRQHEQQQRDLAQWRTEVASHALNVAEKQRQLAVLAKARSDAARALIDSEGEAS